MGEEVGEMFARPTVPTMAVPMTGSWSSEVGVGLSVRRLALRWKAGGCMLAAESCLNASAGRFPLPLSDPTDPFLLLEVTTAEVPIPNPTTSLPKTATFNNNSYNPVASFQPPPKEQDPHHARLNALLSSGDGMDTFGNTGEMRIPAQHTAPGTFVNSAGAGLGRLTGQQTGTNPFLQNQYTGMPQTQYGAAGHQIPAATGPAGMSNGFGGGYQQQNANPFGQRPQQNNGQGGDLIQF